MAAAAGGGGGGGAGGQRVTIGLPDDNSSSSSSSASGAASASRRRRALATAARGVFLTRCETPALAAALPASLSVTAVGYRTGADGALAPVERRLKRRKRRSRGSAAGAGTGAEDPDALDEDDDARTVTTYASSTTAFYTEDGDGGDDAEGASNGERRRSRQMQRQMQVVLQSRDVAQAGQRVMVTSHIVDARTGELLGSKNAGGNRGRPKKKGLDDEAVRNDGTDGVDQRHRNLVVVNGRDRTVAHALATAVSAGVHAGASAADGAFPDDTLSGTRFALLYVPHANNKRARLFPVGQPIGLSLALQQPPHDGELHDWNPERNLLPSDAGTLGAAAASSRQTTSMDIEHGTDGATGGATADASGVASASVRSGSATATAAEAAAAAQHQQDRTLLTQSFGSRKVQKVMRDRERNDLSTTAASAPEMTAATLGFIGGEDTEGDSNALRMAKQILGSEQRALQRARQETLPPFSQKYRAYEAKTHSLQALAQSFDSPAATGRAAGEAKAAQDEQGDEMLTAHDVYDIDEVIPPAHYDAVAAITAELLGDLLNDNNNDNDSDGDSDSDSDRKRVEARKRVRIGRMQWIARLTAGDDMWFPASVLTMLRRRVSDPAMLFGDSDVSQDTVEATQRYLCQALYLRHLMAIFKCPALASRRKPQQKKQQDQDKDQDKEQADKTAQAKPFDPKSPEDATAGRAPEEGVSSTLAVPPGPEEDELAGIALATHVPEELAHHILSAFASRRSVKKKKKKEPSEPAVATDGKQQTMQRKLVWSLTTANRNRMLTHICCICMLLSHAGKVPVRKNRQRDEAEHEEELQAQQPLPQPEQQQEQEQEEEGEGSSSGSYSDSDSESDSSNDDESETQDEEKGDDASGTKGRDRSAQKAATHDELTINIADVARELDLRKDLVTTAVRELGAVINAGRYSAIGALRFPLVFPSYRFRGGSR